MRKLFFAIYFSLLPLSWVQAKVTEVMTQQDIPQKQVSQQTTPETKVITKEDLFNAAYNVVKLIFESSIYMEYVKENKYD